LRVIRHSGWHLGVSILWWVLFWCGGECCFGLHLKLLKARCFIEISSMPEPEVPSYVLTLVLLLSGCLSLLGLLLIVNFRMFRRLGRIERLVGAVRVESQPVEIGPSAAEKSPGGAFEAFLNQDPSRRGLSKAEQFAAYRQWRQQNGMNWSNS